MRRTVQKLGSEGRLTVMAAMGGSELVCASVVGVIHNGPLGR